MAAYRRSGASAAMAAAPAEGMPRQPLGAAGRPTRRPERWVSRDQRRAGLLPAGTRRTHRGCVVRSKGASAAARTAARCCAAVPHRSLSRISWMWRGTDSVGRRYPEGAPVVVPKGGAQNSWRRTTERSALVRRAASTGPSLAR